MRRFISPLTRRILAVNLAAPAILAVGLVYIDEYRGLLIESQVNALFGQAELMAAALGEAALTLEDDSRALDVLRARQVLLRLVGTNEVRARLFDAKGDLIADSRSLIAAGRGFTSRPLPPPTGPEPTLFTRFLAAAYDGMARFWPSDPALPPYQESPLQAADQYAEVVDALAGDASSNLRGLNEGRILMSVAVPVQGLRSIKGALMLSLDTSVIEQQVRDERVKLLQLFLAALVATILVSIYLAASIIRPIRRLARAADQVRHREGRAAEIPDFSRRRDEIGDLSESLRNMTEALAARMDAIESFAADVAHELKNPLTSLRSAVESFARVKDDEKRARLAEILIEDVKRLNRLITDISDASRLDAELARDEPSRVDLTQLLPAIAHLYENSSVQVTADLPQTSLYVEALDIRLARLLRNLVDNAISFSPPDGHIWMRLDRMRGLARITIEDEGPGLPENRKEQIFSRFYTERPKGEAFGQHSGLGLAIARQIAERYGGRLWAENRYNDKGQILGARFLLELPLS